MVVATGAAVVALAPTAATAGYASSSPIGGRGELAATSDGNTSWVMRGDPGDYIGQGNEYAYADGDQIVASGSGGSVRLSVASWQAWFDAPAGETLEPGTYENAIRSPFQENGPGLSIFGDGRGCNELTGMFTVHEVTFDEAGELQAFSVSFAQHCEGGAPALYGSIAWHASEPAWPVQPTVSLTAPKRPAGFGDRVTVVARLSPDSPIRELSLYARAGGRLRLVQTGKVDAHGVLQVDVAPRESTTYVVKFDGQDAFADASDAARVEVAARVAEEMVRYERRSGRYHLYRASRDAYVKAKVSPNHAGDCVVFRAEFRVGGSWQYPSKSKCVTLARTSTALARLRGHENLIGIPIRFRVTWAGDDRNASAESRWSYAKFIR